MSATVLLLIVMVLEAFASLYDAAEVQALVSEIRCTFQGGAHT